MILTTQEIYKKEILICCPSKGRADTCTTHKVLPSVKYFVSEDEYEDYVKNVGVDNVIKVSRDIQCPPVGKCRTLNYILDNYKTEDNVILFTDDDIKYISRVDFLDNNRAIKTNEDELFCLIRKMAFIAKNIGAKIGGFACLGNPDILQMGLSNGFKFTQKKYIDGKAFLIFEDDGTRYDEELYLKEDIDFNCQSLLKNKRTLSAQFVCFVGKALTNRGGVVDVRSEGKELEQGKKMIDKYGDMLVLRISTTGNGVRKKAVQFGIK
jgi:hypothetical protein